MAGALSWPIAREKAARGKQLRVPYELSTVGGYGVADLVPGDWFAALMNRARKDGLRALDFALGILAADAHL